MKTSWEEVLGEIAACEKCRLSHMGRLHTVPGEGDPQAKLMFIGEGPGQEEDRQGRPFVGPSGMLLTAMIEAIGLKRQDVYIANIVKCRPPGNRNPLPEEAEACLPYLRAQFALIRPKIVVLLGKVACTYTVGNISVMREHGNWVERKGVYFMPTFHPSALLRDPSLKRAAWEDLKKVRDRLKALSEE